MTATVAYYTLYAAHFTDKLVAESENRTLFSFVHIF